MVMQDKDEKKALISMAQFFLREETGSIRDALYDGLVEQAIYRRGGNAVLLSDIPQAIKDIYPVDIPQRIIKTSLDRLTRIGTVVRQKDNSFFVTQNREKELSKSANDRKNSLDLLSNNFEQEVKSILKRDITAEESETIKKKIFLFIANFLIPRSKFSATLLVGKTIDFSSELVVENILKSTLIDVEESLLKGAIKKAIINTFQKMDSGLTEILFNIVQNLYLLEVLNLDPDCQCLQKAEFSKITFLLDTNTIVSLLCTTDNRRHKIVADFMDICKSLGVKAKVSNLTIAEYNHLLENSNKLYSNTKIPAVLLGDYPDPFISSYAEEIKQNPNETWEGYYLKMKRLGGDAEKAYGIKKVTYDWSDIFERPYFKEIMQAIAETAENYRGSPKHEEVARHDAAHMILIRELRDDQQSTIFGPNIWFATLDHTLLKAEQYIDKYYPDSLPSSMYCDIWVQMVAPFLVSSTIKASAPEIFAHFISCQFWDGNKVNYADLNIIKGDWLDYSKLNEQDLREILSEKFVKEYIKTVRGYIGEEKEIPVETKEKFEKELSVKIEGILGRRINDIENELKDKDERLKKIEAENQQMAQNKIDMDRAKIVWCQVAGVLAIILFVANIYMVATGLIDLTIYSVPYLLGSGIVICVLLMIAIAYDKVTVALKMIINLTSNGKE